jgi:citrate synthase
MDQITRRKKGWWDTAIIRVRPNELRIRGYAIEELMGRVTFGEMAYLMIMGQLPSHPQITGLLDALLVAVCDHGANSPAVATSIMAATCGIPLNCVMASGMNLLGEIHGGPIEAATRLFYRTDRIIQESSRPPEDVIQEICEEFCAAQRFMPGFGHPVHDRDPRVIRLFELVQEAQKAGVVSGRFMQWALMFEHILPKVLSKKKIPLNVDGGGAAVLCEADIPAEAAMGFVCLSRGLGLMAHGFETQMRKERLKAPMPPDLIAEHMTYSGPSPRKLIESRHADRRNEAGKDSKKR